MGSIMSQVPCGQGGMPILENHMEHEMEATIYEL